MKTTVVPAQITSVEDRIAGNLSFKQLLLLVAPVFISTALFIFLPPFTQYRLYKVVISLIIASICLILALRVKGHLVVDWISTLSHYNLRPRYYIFNKNDTTSRKVMMPEKATKQVPEKSYKEKLPLTQLAFTTGDVINFENTLSNPQTDFHFLRSKKGGLRVHIKEIK
jgi:hypothetical protein